MSDPPLFVEKLIFNIERIIIGKTQAVELAVICLLSEGHLLIEDIPGVGKTMLARSLARSLGVEFSRIQFTPDMLPSDITGISFFNQSTREFEYRPGPIMANIVLTDEINRATPKTQSALLEAMQERQVTVEGVSHPLPKPFMVLATQNPIEYEGTFPLPEAQRDRFMMRIKLGYLGKTDEMRLLYQQKNHHPLEDLEPIAGVEDLTRAQRAVREIHVSQAVEQYIVDLVDSTRNHPEITLGASPRGSLGLYRVSQARAWIRSRDYVLPDDVKALALTVLSHRMIISPKARLRELQPEQLLEELLLEVAVPGGEHTRQEAASPA
ncbi:MAG: AAA family ATPase [Anaerolineales bacterium]